MLETRKSKRKPTGGLRSSLRRRDKRLKDLANAPTMTTVGPEKRKIYRGKGGNEKVKVYATEKVNVVIDGKTVPAKILSVKKNIANKEFVRRNIITKGAELEIEYKGKKYNAKVTSRPGQTGIVSATLI